MVKYISLFQCLCGDKFTTKRGAKLHKAAKKVKPDGKVHIVHQVR